MNTKTLFVEQAQGCVTSARKHALLNDRTSLPETENRDPSGRRPQRRPIMWQDEPFLQPGPQFSRRRDAAQSRRRRKHRNSRGFRNVGHVDHVENNDVIISYNYT